MKIGLISAIVLASFASLAPSSVAAEAPDSAKAQITALAAHVIEAANAGDNAALARTTASGDHTTIDNFPPFTWKGPKALSLWLKDYGHDLESNAITDANSKIGEPQYVRIEGTRAYAVFPDTYTYKKGGRDVRENLLWTFVAGKAGPEWKLISWSFGGGPQQ